MTYYSLDNTELKKFVSELVNQDENNIVTTIKYNILQTKQRTIMINLHLLLL